MCQPSGPRPRQKAPDHQYWHLAVPLNINPDQRTPNKVLFLHNSIVGYIDPIVIEAYTVVIVLGVPVAVVEFFIISPMTAQTAASRLEALEP